MQNELSRVLVITIIGSCLCMRHRPSARRVYQ